MKPLILQGFLLLFLSVTRVSTSCCFVTLVIGWRALGLPSKFSETVSFFNLSVVSCLEGDYMCKFGLFLMELKV